VQYHSDLSPREAHSLRQTCKALCALVKVECPPWSVHQVLDWLVHWQSPLPCPEQLAWMKKYCSQKFADARRRERQRITGILVRTQPLDADPKELDVPEFYLNAAH